MTDLDVRTYREPLGPVHIATVDAFANGRPLRAFCTCDHLDQEVDHRIEGQGVITDHFTHCQQQARRRQPTLF